MRIYRGGGVSEKGEVERGGDGEGRRQRAVKKEDILGSAGHSSISAKHMFSNSTVFSGQKQRDSQSGEQTCPEQLSKHVPLHVFTILPNAHIRLSARKEIQ